MKTFVLSLPKDFQLYSQKLDVYAVLCQHSWNIINGGSLREILLFQKDGKVTDSVNGDTNIYTWQYFPQNNSLLLNLTEGRGFLFKFAFYSKELLVMHKDGTNEYLLMANETLVEMLGEKALMPYHVEQYLASLRSKKTIDYTMWWENRKKLIPNSPTPPVEPPTYDSCLQEKQKLIEFRDERNKIIESLQKDEVYLSVLDRQEERKKSKWLPLILMSIFILLLLFATIIPSIDDCCWIFVLLAGGCFFWYVVLSSQGGNDEVAQYRYDFMHEFCEKYKRCYESCGVDAAGEYSAEFDGLSSIINGRINELDVLMKDLRKQHPSSQTIQHGT